jgi:hypothetical protein
MDSPAPSKADSSRTELHASASGDRRSHHDLLAISSTRIGNESATSLTDRVLELVGNVSDVDPDQVVTLLGELERLRVRLLARVFAADLVVSRTVRETDPLSDLQHLTPQRVGALLDLKPTYVHELCRTGKLAATKSGKYWMVSVAGLRQWLRDEKRPIDGEAEVRLESVPRTADAARTERRPKRPGSRV